MNKNITLTIVILLLTFNIQLLTGKKKVACIGNSITEAVGLPSSDSYPMIMQTLLNPNEYEVRNFGVSGRTLIKKGDWPYWNEDKYKQSLEWNPDIVIIKLGTNDVNPRNNWAHIDDYINDYLEFIDSYKKRPSKPKIYVCYPAPAFKDNFMGIDDQKIIVEQLIPKINIVAEKTNSEIIDLHTPLISKGRFFYDKIHPNYRGTTYMAHIVAKAICPTCDIDPISEDFLLDIATFDFTDGSIITSSLGDADLSSVNDNDGLTGVSIPDEQVTINLELKSPLNISGYSITVGRGDALNFPKSWELKGSITGRIWYSLDQRTDQVFDSLETNICKMNAPGANRSYKYYRLVMPQRGSGKSFSLNELQLFGVPANPAQSITSNGGTVIGEYEGYPGELVGNLIDKNIGTKYCVVDKNGGWMQYNSPSKVKVGKYMITSSKDLAERDLKSWIFSGSNDGLKWNELDAQTNQNFAGPYHAMEFEVNNPEEYSMYRLMIKEIKRSSTFQLAEWQMFEYKGSSIEENVINTRIYTKNGIIYLDTDDGSIKEFSLWDVSGKLLESGTINNGKIQLKQNIKGFVLLRLLTDRGSIVNKVVL